MTINKGAGDKSECASSGGLSLRNIQGKVQGGIVIIDFYRSIEVWIMWFGWLIKGCCHGFLASIWMEF